jgi:hypothetical protein
MDFMPGLLGGKGNDAIYVIIDRLTKSALLILVKMTNLEDKLAKIYMNKVVRLHGIPTSIVSDQDPMFTSCLWPNIQHT